VAAIAQLDVLITLNDWAEVAYHSIGPAGIQQAPSAPPSVRWYGSSNPYLWGVIPRTGFLPSHHHLRSLPDLPQRRTPALADLLPEVGVASRGRGLVGQPLAASARNPPAIPFPKSAKLADLAQMPPAGLGRPLLPPLSA
jgi:hypothetical protein